MKEDKFSNKKPDSQIASSGISTIKLHLKKLVLSLDKFLDIKYQRKAIYMAIGLGVVAFLLLTWLIHLGKVTVHIAVIIKISAFIWLLILETIKRDFGKTDRHLPASQRMKNKLELCYRCNRVYLPIYGQKHWMKDRFTEHYTCLVSPFITWFLGSFTICNVITFAL